MSKEAPQSRISQLKADAKDEDFEPDMPDAGSAAYLLEHFWGIGPTQGDGVITSGELRDYQANMGITLSPWECRVLRRLSVDYLNESQRATKRDCKPPFTESSDLQRIVRAEFQRKRAIFLGT